MKTGRMGAAVCRERDRSYQDTKITIHPRVIPG